jgi:hypothetical protein
MLVKSILVPLTKPFFKSLIAQILSFQDQHIHQLLLVMLHLWSDERLSALLYDINWVPCVIGEILPLWKSTRTKKLWEKIGMMSWLKFRSYTWIHTNAHYVKTSFQLFTSDAPRSSFKQVVVSTLRLLRNLHMMSLAKAVPNALKDHECKKIALHKRPPILYVPDRDIV